MKKKSHNFYQSYEYMGFEESKSPIRFVMQNSILLAPHHSFLLPRENQFSTVLLMLCSFTSYHGKWGVIFHSHSFRQHHTHVLTLSIPHHQQHRLHPNSAWIENTDVPTLLGKDPLFCSHGNKQQQTSFKLVQWKDNS